MRLFQFSVKSEIIYGFSPINCLFARPRSLWGERNGTGEGDDFSADFHFSFLTPQPSSDREDSSNFAVGRLILNAEDGSDIDRANGNGVVNGFASGGVNWHFVDFTAADAAKHSSNGSEK